MFFCSEKQVDKLNPSLKEILQFLTELQQEGLSYSAINTAKSMLSAILQIIHAKDIGNEVLIKRFMKGVFQLKPSFPKTGFTWDVKVVLKYLDTMPNHKLTLRLLSVKLAVLLALTTGQRCQTLKAININNMELDRDKVKIRVGELLKQSKPQRHLNEIYIEKFEQNSNICVINVLELYLKKTERLRTDANLFIITQKPYSAASKSTVAAWIRLGLKLAGIDLGLFTPHSTRSASTSAVVSRVPIDTIIKTAGWSTDCTFRKFYKRPVTNNSEFSRAVLEK